MLSVDLASASWAVGALPPGLFKAPSDTEGVGVWCVASVPGTVASSKPTVAEAGALTPKEYDDWDWLFRTTVDLPDSEEPTPRVLLELEGLATVCEVWLNGIKVLDSRNMFRRYTVDVSHAVQTKAELLLVFRGLNPILAEKRPRPRWKTRLVEEQNLRFIRTSLLGRVASWAPRFGAIGPWRPVRLRQLTSGDVEVFTYRTLLDVSAGTATFCGSVWSPIATPEVEIEVGHRRYSVPVIRRGDHLEFDWTLACDEPPVWWPHTHGSQGSLAFTLLVGGAPRRTGALRFRAVQLDRSAGKVGFIVNATPVFVRGACWTVSDIESLQNEPGRLRSLLEAAKALGLNLLRVGGTMTYEDDAFYALCDELGIMVWQDFMFANMDYPFAEATFRAEVTAEATQLLQRLAQHGSVVAYCGGSEVEQQAAMVGLPKEDWTNEFVADELPRLCSQYHGQTVYFPSSPCGGDLPFHPSEGIVHYYGVGAYQRDISDLATARVKFASECLGFANIPGARSLQKFFGSSHPAPHLPAWKAGVHRDNGSGWDFEDVRDHYLQRLFGVDPVALRYSDLERYFALSSVVSGEVMTQVFTAWRQPDNVCSGGIVWFFNDFVPGAGWGLIDSTGAPKPAAFLLKQTLQPLQVLLEDRGLGGHVVALLNETPEACGGKLVVELWQSGRICTARAEENVNVAPRTGLTINVDALLGHFHDTTWSYRFGPRKHEVVTARWVGANGRLISQAVRFVGGGYGAWVERCNVMGAIVQEAGETFVQVETDALLHFAQIDVRECTAIDNFVHLIPGQVYRLRVEQPAGLTRLRGDLTALNYADSVRIASS